MKRRWRSRSSRDKAEAARWIARLHSGRRTEAEDAELRDWLAADTRHSEAFDAMTSVWERAGGAMLRVPADQPSLSRRHLLLASGAAVAIVGAAVVLRRPRPQEFATALGEQRRVALNDGSTLILDTDSRLSVLMGSRSREVTLDQGRAHFQVASDPERPFIVTAGERQVVAIGTAFDVMRAQRETSVLLIEGKVAVKAASAAPAALRMIQPGQRLTMDDGGAERLDRPPLDKLTAWQQGRLEFSDDPLREAIAEVNRYSPRAVVLAAPELADERISGVYATGDAEAFANAAAILLSADVRTETHRIVLARKMEQGAK